MNKFERKIGALSACLALAIGASACGGDQEPKGFIKPPQSGPCHNKIDVTSLRLLDSNKTGGWNTINTGDCVPVIGPKSGFYVGATIAHNRVFIVECIDESNPVSLRVEAAGGIEGDVYLDYSVSKQLHYDKDYSKGAELQGAHLASC